MSILLAGMLAVAAPSAGGSEVVWKWVPEQSSCRLRQDAGNGKFLDVGGRPGNRNLVLSIIDTKARAREQKSVSAVGLTFTPGEPASVEGWIQPHRDPIGRSIAVSLGGQELVEFSKASALGLSHAEFGTERISIRSAGAALDAIRACEDRKLKEWGVDLAAWRALTSPPTPTTSPAKWFSWADYPDREKIYKNDIDVVARLDVAADGSVTNCTVVNRPPAEFVPAACNALRRNAQFRPALDAQGQPVAAPYIFVVRFGAYHL